MEKGWFPSVESKGQVVGRFRYEPVLDIAKSREADEHIYRDVIVLEHKIVGSHDNSVTQLKPFNEKALRARFPGAWEAFQGQEVKVDGTPVAELGLTDDQILTLRIQGVSTLEQVANMSDATCGNMGFGWRKNRDRAIAILKARVEKLMEPGLVANIEQRVGALETPPAPADAVSPPAATDAPAVPEKRGPGRPRKFPVASAA